MSTDAAWREWIEDARRVKVAAFCRSRGIKLRGKDVGQPCPAPGCGGRDRFSVNADKNVFYCRGAGVGGDAIALAQHIDGTNFIAAVEAVTGRPPPGRDAAESDKEQRAREKRLAEEAAARSAKEADDERIAALFREDERKRAHRIWRDAAPAAGSMVEDYLALRGVALPPRARLRFSRDLPLWDRPPPGGAIIHRGPAMVAAIEGPDGRFSGVHRTWIDLASPKGKVEIRDADGELVDVKKVRGSKKGGSIFLARGDGFDDWAKPVRLFVGEGVETVLSVYWSLREASSPLMHLAEFRTSVDLDNLAGKAKGRVRHPTLLKSDKHGRPRPVFVRSGEPDFDSDWPLMPIAESVADLYLLGDGDSEPFATRLALERAGKRYAAACPWLTIHLAMSRPGADFNDMRMKRDAA
jgi:hypothetical protein